LTDPLLSRCAAAMTDDTGILTTLGNAELMRARSPLARWMLRNHDAFAARYTARRVDWSVLAQVFAEAGLTDADGNPPNRVTARKTWQRVRQMHRQMAPGPAPEPSPPAQPPTRSPPAPVQGDDRVPPKRFGTAALRGHTPSAPLPAAPSAAAAGPFAARSAPQPDPDRADKVIAELLGGRLRGRFAPKPNDEEHARGTGSDNTG
jgi:hypothetical protein